jgi:hypothetical protein
MESKNYFDTLEVDNKWRDVFTHKVFGYGLSTKHAFFKHYPVDRKNLTKARLLYEKKRNRPCVHVESLDDFISSMVSVRDECEYPEVKKIIDDILSSSYIEKVKKLYNNQETEKVNVAKRKIDESCVVLNELKDFLDNRMYDYSITHNLKNVHEATDYLKTRVETFKRFKSS